MSQSEADVHLEAMNRFIELANQIRNEGVSQDLVSASLMSASAVYATFAAVGNSGGLHPSGVDKVVAAYRTQLERVQEARKAEQEAG